MVQVFGFCFGFWRGGVVVVWVACGCCCMLVFSGLWFLRYRFAATLRVVFIIVVVVVVCFGDFGLFVVDFYCLGADCGDLFVWFYLIVLFCACFCAL